EQSGTGFLFITRDSRITKTTWDLVRAFGGAGIKLYSTTGTVLDRISSGEHLIAYNMIGSYAIERAKEDASIGIVFPADYITLMSRIAFIPVTARHPESAKLFLDYLLSERGQKFLLARSVGTVRLGLDADGVIPADRIDAVKPIHIGPELLTYLDQSKRASFLKEWRRALRDPEKSRTLDFTGSQVEKTPIFTDSRTPRSLSERLCGHRFDIQCRPCRH